MNTIFIYRDERAFLIFIVLFPGILVIGYLLGNPEAGAAIDNQPISLIGFMFDISYVKIRYNKNLLIM